MDTGRTEVSVLGRVDSKDPSGLRMYCSLTEMVLSWMSRSFHRGATCFSYMFPSPLTGELYHPDSAVNLHKKILRGAGLDYFRFYDLRHTFATTALPNGVDVKTGASMPEYFDPASPSTPTPTPPDRSRTKQPRPWETS